MIFGNFEPKWYVWYAYYNHDYYNYIERDICMQIVKSQLTNSQIKTQRKYHTTSKEKKIHVI